MEEYIPEDRDLSDVQVGDKVFLHSFWSPSNQLKRCPKVVNVTKVTNKKYFFIGDVKFYKQNGCKVQSYFSSSFFVFASKYSEEKEKQYAQYKEREERRIELIDKLKKETFSNLTLEKLEAINNIITNQ